MGAIQIKRRPDGVFFCRPYLGTNIITGKPMRPYRCFPEARTEEEALTLAQKWVESIAPAIALKVLPTLDELLYRYIDVNEADGTFAFNTVKTYRSLVRCYISAHVGSLDIDDIKPYMIVSLYNVCLLSGARNGGGISPNTVIKLHQFLSGAWKWFVEKGLTPFNPIQSVDPPPRAAHEAVAYSEVEFQVISEALDDAIRTPAATEREIFERNVAFGAYLALWNAERCGEVCGHIRADARFLQKTMHICATAIETDHGVKRQLKTKGKKSRNIAIDESVCDALCAHYEWQKSYLPASRQPSTPILTNHKREFLRPSKVSERYSQMRDDLGLPKKSSFHTLRHTHATWMLLNGATLADVQERLGHASESTTLGLYIHLTPGRGREAVRIFANAVDRIKGGGGHE